MDMDKLRIELPYVAYELPTGAKIWTQDVVGYDYTIISGVGACTPCCSNHLRVSLETEVTRQI